MRLDWVATAARRRSSCSQLKSACVAYETTVLKAKLSYLYTILSFSVITLRLKLGYKNRCAYIVNSKMEAEKKDELSGADEMVVEETGALQTCHLTCTLLSV